MLNSIIFSKDRPCQVELLLRSLEMFFVDWEKYRFTVLYTYTSEQSRLGYDIVIKEHPGFNYICQRDYGLSFKLLVEDNLKIENPYTMFFVDDQVFKNTFTFDSPEFIKFQEDQDIMSVSLRLCPRMDYCYPIDRYLSIPNFLPDGSWYWRESHGDWSYTMSLDSNIYRTAELLPLIKRVEYHDPNSFEGQLSINSLPNNRVICFQDSKVFNVPANRVQETSLNRHGNISNDFLNTLFLKGKRISFSNLLDIQNRAPHHEVEFILE